MARIAVFLVAVLLSLPALAQHDGGVLRILHRDSPGAMSILEETSNSVITPMMGVFNNLVLYDQHVAQNRMDTIRPDLATEWTWNDDRTALTLKLRQGVRWHDGKPFTAADVVCTWDRVRGVSADKLRINPRYGWYKFLTAVVANGDFEVVFRLKRPQPSFLAFLASGYSPVYPCHVTEAEMRVHPVGTGPYRFVEYKRNESIKLERNKDYWKPGLPHLDGIEYTIIPNRSTAALGFEAGKFDVTFPYEMPMPVVREIEAAAPAAHCEVTPNNLSTNLLINRAVAPFDKPDVRKAMALAIDRKTFIDIISEGKNDRAGALLPPPEGVWGLPPDILRTLPGYGEDAGANRAEAQRLMVAAGYGPDKRLAVKLATRNVPQHRDPSVILIDQLKQIYIDAELELIETAIWPVRLTKRDYAIALNLTGSGGDDPDIQFYENYVCDASRNFSGYCNPEIDALVDRQSQETDFTKRRQMVWDIDKRLQEDFARPIIYLARSGTCLQPWVKNFTVMSNGMYSGSRMEDVWLNLPAAGRP